MATFKRNAIIAGYINSYCLVCECFFETEEQTFSHIKEDEHETKLQLYPYIEKYGNNCIRKVKAGYFCEHCSLLMATAAKVNLHVAEKMHYSNKGNSLLKRSGSILTAFDDVLIADSAWHSFTDDACALCDVEFDAQEEHKVSQAHVMKLLQNKIEFGDNNNLYRRIDKNDFQCLTCNCVPQTAIEEHFNDDTHKQKYKQCQEDKKKYDLANPKKVKELKIEVKTATDTLNNVETIAGNDVDKETPKKAQDTETGNNMADKTAKKHSKPIKEAKLEADKEIDQATYAKENKLAFDPRNVNAFCKTCKKKFPSTLYGMKEHVLGRDHINKTKAPKPAQKQTKLEKKIMEDFVNSISAFDNNGVVSIVINENICVSEKSCHFFTEIGSRSAEYKCEICSMNFKAGDLYDHCGLANHTRGLRKAYIILSVKNEFIREIRPETFHCGFCNLMLSSWSATEEHLKTNQHKMNHAACQRKLQTHLPAIRAQKNDDDVKAALFQMVLRHMSN